MRVLQIGGTYVGAQRIIEGETHRWLIKNGHESRVLYAIGEPDDENTVCYETRPENLSRRLFSKIFGNNPRYARPQTRRMIRYIKEWKPDVVHLHVLHHGYTDYIFLLDFLAREQIPVVFTMHDMWEATGGCYYYSAQQCDGYRRGCCNCPAESVTLDCRSSQTEKYFSIKKEIFKKLYHPCFVAVSPWVAEEAEQTALSAYPIYTIWNAIRHTETLQFPEKTNDKFVIIGVAACWDERKGIDRFLKLAQLLGDGYEIRLVGDVSPDIRESASRNIVFLGRVNDTVKLTALYAEADLHISMSFEETFGMTFIEAAFAGTKSLGFNKTAIPYVIEKVFGYVIDSNDVSDMVNTIHELNQHRENCKLNSEEMVAVRDFFSADCMAKGYYHVYERAINKK